ncbi:MAG: TerC family protein [Klebsiella pneumoniae]|nr:TerC family protein [Klebsiella pneumoniae]
MLFAWITDPNAWLALGTLTLLEIVLGIDNIIFLSLVVAKLPTAQRAHARRIGLMGAMVMRLALLASIAWVVKLTNPLFTVFGQEISFRDLILLLGGLFLIWKASKEIHESIEGEEEGLKTNVHSFLGAIVQIMLLDIIFSLDSVITAVGLSDHLFIMMAAVWRALTCCVIRKTRCKPQNCSLVTGCNPFSDFTAFYVSQIRLLIDGYGVQLLKRC